jgi:hypothetical protein
MASKPVNQGGQLLSAVFAWLKIFTLNSWRRLCILGRYSIICVHHQRLRHACRVLGQRVLESLAGGEVNPMLAEPVKDSLTRAQAIQATKDRQYQAVARLREKIKSTRSGEPPASGENESPAAEAAGETPAQAEGGPGQ